MSQPLFPSVDSEGKIREQHLPEYLDQDVLEENKNLTIDAAGAATVAAGIILENVEQNVIKFVETEPGSDLWQLTQGESE